MSKFLKKTKMGLHLCVKWESHNQEQCFVTILGLFEESHVSLQLFTDLGILERIFQKEGPALQENNV